MIVKTKLIDLKNEDIFQIHETYGEQFVCDRVTFSANKTLVEICAINLNRMEPYLIRFFLQEDICEHVYVHDRPIRVLRKLYLKNKTFQELKKELTSCTQIINLKRNLDGHDMDIICRKSVLREALESKPNIKFTNIITPSDFYKLLINRLVKGEVTECGDKKLKIRDVVLPSFEEITKAFSEFVLKSIKKGNTYVDNTRINYRREMEITIDNIFDKSKSEFLSFEKYASTIEYSNLINFIIDITFKLYFSDTKFLSYKWLNQKYNSLSILFKL